MDTTVLLLFAWLGTVLELIGLSMAAVVEIRAIFARHEHQQEAVCHHGSQAVDENIITRGMRVGLLSQAVLSFGVVPHRYSCRRLKYTLLAIALR